MNKPLFDAEERYDRRTQRSQRNESIDTHARARTRLLALQLLLADHHAGRELRAHKRARATLPRGDAML
jgi:hypothetical protein